MFFMCAYSLQRWRQRTEAGHFNIGWLAAALVTFHAALLTNQSRLILFPILLALAGPRLGRRLVSWKALFLTILLIVVLVGSISVLAYLFPGQRFGGGLLGLLRRILEVAGRRPYYLEALSAYLISPGYSIWSLSPALLLGLPGAYLLARSRPFPELIVSLVALILLVIGYAVIQGQNWYGGLRWGARYLLPLTPFLAVWVLSVIDRLLNKQLPRWAMVVVIGVVVESVFIQFIAVSLPLQA